MDDHVAGLSVRKVFLESFGYSVQTAGSAQDALEMAAKSHFDVVVLDYRMPGMNGLELARVLRRRFPSLPMVLLTGYVLELPEELKGLVSGHVAKGSHPRELLEQLADVLGGSPPRRLKELATTAAAAIARSTRPVEDRKRLVKKKQGTSGGARKPGKHRRSA
ncbi:MAG TPA: response regulator [Terriglobales bacterium]|nr:response regulator [Terriglobales bacterium]